MLPLFCRFGSGLGSLGLMVVPLLCSIFCGNACVTANSRWAFSDAYWNMIAFGLQQVGSVSSDQALQGFYQSAAEYGRRGSNAAAASRPSKHLTE